MLQLQRQSEGISTVLENLRSAVGATISEGFYVARGMFSGPPRGIANAVRAARNPPAGSGKLVKLEDIGSHHTHKEEKGKNKNREHNRKGSETRLGQQKGIMLEAARRMERPLREDRSFSRAVGMAWGRSFQGTERDNSRRGGMG